MDSGLDGVEYSGFMGDVLGLARDAGFVDDDGLTDLAGDPVALSCFMTDYVYGLDAADNNNNCDGEQQPKRIHVVFCVPRKRYKNSNTGGNRMVDQSKSQWLRSYAEQVWVHALESQHELTAVEPDEDTWRTSDVSSDNTDGYAERVAAQEDMVSRASAAVDELKADSKTITALKREYRKTGNDATGERIAEYEKQLADARDNLKYEKKLLTMLRAEQRKTTRKAESKLRSTERKAYLTEKARVNADRRLFNGTVRMMVRTNMVTDHVFDAPNSWPSVKPIQDGGTDTGILWEDDNNTFITSTTFYGGWRASREYYVIEIIVEATDNTGSPFHDTIMLPDRAYAEQPKPRKPRTRKPRNH